MPTGALHWLTGLQGDTADVPTDTAFTLQQQTLAIGQPFALGATHRASEQQRARGSRSTARTTSSTPR